MDESDCCSTRVIGALKSHSAHHAPVCRNSKHCPYEITAVMDKAGVDHVAAIRALDHAQKFHPRIEGAGYTTSSSTQLRQRRNRGTVPYVFAHNVGGARQEKRSSWDARAMRAVRGLLERPLSIDGNRVPMWCLLVLGVGCFFSPWLLGWLCLIMITYLLYTRMYKTGRTPQSVYQSYMKAARRAEAAQETKRKRNGRPARRA
jgi:hypothetical protein